MPSKALPRLFGCALLAAAVSTFVAWEFRGSRVSRPIASDARRHHAPIAASPREGASAVAARNMTPTASLMSVSQRASQPAGDATSSTTPADPLAERDAGYAVIGALQRNDQFDESAAYALRAPAAYRRDLVIAAFHDWARQQPDAAFAAASNLSEASARELALQSVLSGWSRRDPAGLAETALRFPDQGLRDAALTKALRAWMQADPWKAGDWIFAHGDPVVSLAEKMFQVDQR